MKWKKYHISYCSTSDVSVNVPSSSGIFITKTKHFNLIVIIFWILDLTELIFVPFQKMCWQKLYKNPKKCIHVFNHLTTFLEKLKTLKNIWIRNIFIVHSMVILFQQIYEYLSCSSRFSIFPILHVNLSSTPPQYHFHKVNSYNIISISMARK